MASRNFSLLFGLSFILCASPIHPEQGNPKPKDLSSCIVSNQTTTHYSNSHEKTLTGLGFVINDRYYSACHVVSGKNQERDENGYIVVPQGSKDSDVTRIDGIKLEPILMDESIDLAVFQLPRSLADKYRNDVRINSYSELNVGDRIFWYDKDRVYTSGEISTNQEPHAEAKGFYPTTGMFSIGLSGSPTFNEKGEVIGVIVGVSSITETGFIAPFKRRGK